MSAAADRRIAELEVEVKLLREQYIRELGIAHSQRDRFNQIADDWMKKYKSLEAKLVQRDVYEAEARLPPEHAVLIKHLATVEKCIDRSGQDGNDDCPFCDCDTYWDSHNRDCPWIALQLERGVTSVIDDIHAAARRQHEHRERQKSAPREPARPGATLQNVNDVLKAEFGARIQEAYPNNSFLNMISGTPPQHQHVHMTEKQTAEIGAAIHRDLERFYQRAAPPVIVDRSMMLNLFPQAFNPATLPAHEVHSDSGQQGQPGGESRREEHEEGDPALHHRPDDEQR